MFNFFFPFLIAAVATAFDTPEGKPPFDYVFDFTGEVRLDRNELVSLQLRLFVFMQWHIHI